MEVEFQLLFACAEQVDPCCSLDHSFLHNCVPRPTYFYFADAELSEPSDAGEETDKTHKNAHFVAHLLMHVELHLQQTTLTSS